ncbi:MAG: carbon monoxide dehydrogenase subunit G [Bosea sp.]|uniref:CoxG family protein n=1 Tax=Bosea sp. (in: a-proteobacteria) TaxID=1871050 RepID=UPI002397FC47|nr:carbon monoxide dehydrogenase subunit G [Bosea sp. (in: a-proteobacteria)]MCP4733293.1 carbon monoxide dehydrogenase subunit G [Bosea sp. (in: a-proteobacteria)]
MNMDGEQLIPADIETVWRGLNDEEVLKAAIPGCETLTRTSPTGFTAVVAIKIGPVKARFSGEVELSDLDPPNGYRLSGKGSGGIAGFAQGGATVRLHHAHEGTMLVYAVDAQVGGKLAQLGARLIDATARKLAGEFFQRFAARLAPETMAEGNA